MTNLDGILKSRDISWSTKVRLVNAMVFPLVMCGCESWTLKKAERQRIDAFELWCWRRLLRVPWTARRANQSILKISPGYFSAFSSCLNCCVTKIIASVPIISWEIDGETVETVSDYFWGLQNHCRW